jgi:hypothetical protein
LQPLAKNIVLDLALIIKDQLLPVIRRTSDSLSQNLQAPEYPGITGQLMKLTSPKDRATRTTE